MGEGDAVGGSIRLAALLDKHGGALVPDLKYYFGVDLRDLFSEGNPVSPRFALLLIDWLPTGSATVAERRGGPEFRGWDVDRYMAARMVDILNASLYSFVVANSDPKRSRPSQPDPFPTPDVRAAKHRSAEGPGTFAGIAKALLARSKKQKNGG